MTRGEIEETVNADSDPPNSMQSKAVTLKDIAARCGFSVGTVSRALLRDARISATTTQAILAIATEMGYDPSHNVAARRMVLRQHGRVVHNRAIAFYSMYATTQYQHRIIDGIWHALACSDQILILVPSHNPQTRERVPLPAVFKSGDVDGMILLEQSYWVEPIVAEMRSEPNFGSRPIVSIVIPIPETSTVLPDYREGGRLAAGHLFDLGHRHLLHFYAGEDQKLPAVLRLAGYHDACRERGLDPAHCLHAHFNKKTLEWEHELGISEFLNFLRRHPSVTGILARHDLEAIKLIRALTAHGRRVPDDFSVIGFDDTNPLYGHDGENRLSSVRLPLEEIGEEAVRVITQEIEHGRQAETHLVLPVELVARATTAPPRS